MHEHSSRAILKVAMQKESEEIAQGRVDGGSEHEL